MPLPTLNLIVTPTLTYNLPEGWRMPSIGAFIKHEIREMIPSVIYFAIAFNVIGFMKVLMLRE